MAGIKNSVGIVSLAENGGSHSDRPGHESTGAPNRQAQIFRCQVNGKTIYSDLPCDGARSKIYVTTQSAGIQTADPVEVAKFRAEAFAARLLGQPKPVSGEPSSAETQSTPSESAGNGAVRARCDKLAKYIAYLDERARQPLSRSEQAQNKKESKDRKQLLSDLDCVRA